MNDFPDSKTSGEFIAPGEYTNGEVTVVFNEDNAEEYISSTESVKLTEFR